MQTKQWYESLYVNYGQKYDQEVFTQGTSGECDFIEQELNFDRSLRLLDVGCGTGRHTIELTKRGYTVVGIDLSDNQLHWAREKASEAGLTIDFQRLDARKMPFNKEFDAIIMLCEGGFSLMETDEMNYEILRSASRALKTQGKFIFTTLNALFPLHHSLEAFHEENSTEESSKCRKNSFDWMTLRDRNVVELTDDDGQAMTLDCNERYYVPSEITWMLKSLNFTQIDILGSHLGEFSRQHTLTTDDFEMLVVASRS